VTYLDYRSLRIIGSSRCAFRFRSRSRSRSRFRYTFSNACTLLTPMQLPGNIELNHKNFDHIRSRSPQKYWLGASEESSRAFGSTLESSSIHIYTEVNRQVLWRHNTQSHICLLVGTEFLIFRSPKCHGNTLPYNFSTSYVMKSSALRIVFSLQSGRKFERACLTIYRSPPVLHVTAESLRLKDSSRVCRGQCC